MGRRATALMIVGLTVLTWPALPLTPASGSENSWVIGLSLALARGVSFATRVVFTYGPLGPVLHPIALSGGTVALGVVGAGIVHVALVTVLLCTLRPRVGLLAGAVLTLLAVLVVTASSVVDVLDAIAFGIVSLSLARPTEESAGAAQALAIGGGVFSAFALLTELNQGVAVTAIVAVGLVGGARPGRNLAIGVLSLLVTLVCAWLALGQPLGAIPDYVSNGYQTVAGYADAMGYNMASSGDGWTVGVMLASALALSACAWRAMASAPVARRTALVLDVLIVHYFVAREMFTRYDEGHIAAIALLPAIALLIPWRRRQATVAAATAIAVTAACLLALSGAGNSTGSVFDLVARVRGLVDNVGTVVSPQGAITKGRAQIRLADKVPKSIVAALDGHCVNAEPWEIAAIFAYPSWRWCPIGVMDSYEAYTTTLDDLDAAGYANSRSGPDRVLRADETIDERNPTWDSPAAMLSLLCHFREIARGGQWQALARIPDRCGRPYVVETLHVGKAGAKLPPAPPGTVLIAKLFGLQVGGLERIESLLTRARMRFVYINTSVWRVPPGTVSDGLVLDVPRKDDYAPPFSFNLDAKTIRVMTGGAEVAFTVKLVAVPIS
jgi:hypothetical protein